MLIERNSIAFAESTHSHFFASAFSFENRRENLTMICDSPLPLEVTGKWDRPTKRCRSTPTNVVSVEENQSMISSGVSSGYTFTGLSVPLFVPEGMFRNSHILEGRPTTETAIETITYLAKHPCESVEIIKMICQSKAKTTQTCEDNKISLRTAKLEQLQQIKAIEGINTQLMSEKAELEDIQVKFRKVEEELFCCKASVHELNSDHEMYTKELSINDQKVRCTTFMTTLSNSIIASDPKTKPFANLSLAAIRKRMKLENTDALITMRNESIRDRIMILANFGIEVNLEFRGLWNEHDAHWIPWSQAHGPLPKIHKGRHMDEKN